MGNTFGRFFRVTTFGESHGSAIGAVIDGCPPRIPFDLDAIQCELDRRRPGQSAVTTSRKEADRVSVLSGVFDGKTLGTPIALVIENTDQRSADYKNVKNVYRPGHADHAWELKYGFRDYRGGGRSSGRETACRVMAGALAEQVMRIIGKKWFGRVPDVFAYASEIGGIRGSRVKRSLIEKNPVRAADPEAAKKMEAAILKAKSEGDSLGGTVSITVKNMPAGLGEPVFNKLNAALAQALFSIATVKAVEIGSGFEAGNLKGSEHNKRAIGGQGGISGGISTGGDLEIRVTVKPPSSIGKVQNMKTKRGGAVRAKIEGRHDPCIIPRFIPVAEAMTRLVLVDFMLAQRLNQLIL